MKRARVFLPDDVIFDILQRLPAKSILKFRAISKSWDSLISDPYFLLSHARRAKPSVLLARSTQSSLAGLHLQTNGSCIRTQTTTLEIRYPHLYLLASCDGLLCFRGISIATQTYVSPGYYYVCNPLTDEWITLPESSCPYGFTCAFYHHPSVNEYKLLRYSPYGYEILTIGAKEWRRIACLFDTNPSPMLKCYVHCPPRFDNPPISLHGKLHYPHVGISYNWLIMVFDMDSEKFGLMPLPESCRKKSWMDQTNIGLIELEGKLGAYTIASEDAILHIWSLEDYEKQVWVQRYRVLTTATREHLTWFKPLVVHDDGKALVNWNGDLVVCDFKHRTCRKIILEEGFQMTNLLYKESLIRHEFFATGYQTGFITNPVTYFHLQRLAFG